MKREQMRRMIEQRIEEEANFIVNECATVRETAKKFGMGKSTVHRDVTEKLKNINLNLYNDVMYVLECNKEEKHIRGGQATKNKFK